MVYDHMISPRYRPYLWQKISTRAESWPNTSDYCGLTFLQWASSDWVLAHFVAVFVLYPLHQNILIARV